MDQLTPWHRRVAVLAFGARATGIAADVAAQSSAMTLTSIEALVSGTLEADLIVLVAEADDPCDGADRVDAHARAGHIALLALVLGATADSAASPAAMTLRPLADTLVLTTDDELLMVMAHWLERTA